MHRILSITLLFLFAAAGVQAQRLPERSLVRKGNRQYNKGEYEASIGRYEEALKAAPGQFEATYNLGNALYKAERFDRAEQTMVQAAADSLRSDAERAEAFYNLGNAQFKQQKYKEALESYKQSLRLNPADMEAKYNYAYTKRLLDQDQNGGGGNDQQNQNQDQNQQDQQNQQQQNQGQNQNQDQKQDQQDQDQQNQGQNPQDQNGKPDQQEQGEGQPTPSGISPQEQEQMLDAIQAQEDKTQEKLKEKAKGVVVRGKKNW
ncbi:tetratricopeptide repeat protein [uncultured Alistipes sp.]|uniref:tetratricopeptide repeat protein n=1 Tax=uncultured Alistipes sp. TaxID=538949 RepID=UPI003207BD61